MKNVLFGMMLFIGLSSFSQVKPPIKVVMFWETNSDFEKFRNLAESLDPSRYIVEISPAQLYRDTAFEYNLPLQSSRKLARVSPYESPVVETSFIKFYCSESGMPLGTLWCSGCYHQSLDEWYGTCLNLRNEIFKIKNEKEKTRKF
jgi:hypothetical protein